MKIKEYVSKQARFSAGNIVSVPIGSVLLVVLTNDFHIFYLYSSWLSLIATTVINFWMQVFLRTIRSEKQ